MALMRTIFANEPTPPDYQFIASAVFCQPPLATVGWVTRPAGWQRQAHAHTAAAAPVTPPPGAAQGTRRCRQLAMLTAGGCGGGLQVHGG